MFSNSSAPVPGEQRSYKPHAPHFIPWLRNSLKPHHSGDLGLKGPYKSSSEVRNNLTPLERAKGIGLFSIQGKDRAKKGELRCNRVGMARMLPMVLRGHHIQPGNLSKQRRDNPPSCNQPQELHRDPTTQLCTGERAQGLSNSPSSAQDNHTIVKNPSSQLNLLQSQTDRTSTSVGKFGLPAGFRSAPVPEEPKCRLPLVDMEDRRGKVWDYGSNTDYQQRDLRLSSWLNSDSQGPTEGKHGFTSSLSYIKHKSRISKSHKDLTALREPSVECFNGPLNGAIFSTEVPLRGRGFTTTLRGRRTARSSLEHIGILDQNQTWTHHSLTNEGGLRRIGAGCCRKVVRNQIKRVVDNLEQVLGALRDVQQEMKEVVQQIDYLTSAIDLNEEEPHRTTGGSNTELANDGSCPSDTTYGEVTVSSTYQRCLEPEDQPGTTYLSGTLSRDPHSLQQSPPNVPLCQATSMYSFHRSGNFQYSSNMGSSSRQGGTLQYINNVPSANPTLHDLSLSHRSLPVRPPTPGLSPLTVNHHPSNSPGSQPPSPEPYSSIMVFPPTLLHQMPQTYPTPSPSVIIENKMGFYQTPQSDNPSVRKFSPSSTQPPSASCPPTDTLTQPVSNGDGECQASSTVPIHRPSQVSTAPAANAKPPMGQSRKGRKPPPYPHNKLSEHERKKMKEPRKAPPYPEKRKLLSTTV